MLFIPTSHTNNFSHKCHYLHIFRKEYEMFMNDDRRELIRKSNNIYTYIVGQFPQNLITLNLALSVTIRNHLLRSLLVSLINPRYKRSSKRNYKLRNTVPTDRCILHIKVPSKCCYLKWIVLNGKIEIVPL